MVESVSVNPSHCPPSLLSYPANAGALTKQENLPLVLEYATASPSEQRSSEDQRTAYLESWGVACRSFHSRACALIQVTVSFQNQLHISFGR